MTFITLQQMYDAWKRVADWVSGASADKPTVKVTDGTDTLAINADGSVPVQLTGSNVEIPVKNQIRSVKYSLSPNSGGRWCGNGVGYAGVGLVIKPWDVSHSRHKTVYVKNNRSAGAPKISIYLTATLNDIVSPGFTDGLPNTPIPDVIAYKKVSYGLAIGAELLINLDDVLELNTLAVGMFVVVQSGGAGTDEVVLLNGGA